MDKAKQILNAWKLVRRSGVAVALISHFLKWEPDSIYQVGVGLNCKEVDIFQIAWPKAKLVGYEAHPTTVQIMQKHYPGELHAVAITDYEGEADLHVKARHRDGASLLQYPQDIETTAVRTKCTTLDKQEPAGPPTSKTLLWLDCEGSELKVLDCGLNFLEKVEMINIEMTGKPLTEDWPSSVVMHQRLRELGFYLQHIHTQRSAQNQGDMIYVRPHLFSAQYCCCPYSILDFAASNGK